VRQQGRHKNGQAGIEALVEVLLEPLGRRQRRTLLRSAVGVILSNRGAAML
jgi:hypothetical protein